MNSIKLLTGLDTTFMNSINSIIYDPERLLPNLSYKINLWTSDKYAAVSNLSNYYAQKNIKSPYKFNEFKISVPTRNKEFELPDGSYSLSNTQEYFEFILKNDEKVNDIINLSIESHLKIKTGYCLEHLMPETMKLIRSTKIKENAPHLEITELATNTW